MNKNSCELIKDEKYIIGLKQTNQDLKEKNAELEYKIAELEYKIELLREKFVDIEHTSKKINVINSNAMIQNKKLLEDIKIICEV